MLLFRLFIAAPLLFCLAPDSVLSQDVTTTTAAAAAAAAVPPTVALPTEEPPPKGFFRRIFYNIKNMFFKNKNQNVDAGQKLADLFNQTLTQLSEDVQGIKREIEGIGVEFGNVTASFKDPKKDMIGKVLSASATGVSVFAATLQVVNQLTRIVNNFYQAFNRIGDHIYYTGARNYVNWKAMLSYVPNELIAKMIKIFKDILDLLEKIKNIVIAFRNQIQIMMLQATIQYASAAAPFHQAFTFLTDQLNKIVKAIISVILQIHKSVTDMILNIRHATVGFVKGSIERTSQGFKKLTDTVNEIQQNIKSGLENLRPKPKATTPPKVSQSSTLPPGSTTQPTASTAKQ